MPILLRSEKDAPLTWEEMDKNFEDLNVRLKRIESDIKPGERLVQVSLEGRTLSFTGSEGTSFGECVLPLLSFVPRGRWQEKTAYLPLDVVSWGGGAYVCTKAHTSDAFEKEKNIWEILLDGTGMQEEQAQKEQVQGAHLSTISTYAKETLPKNPELGAIALVMDASENSPLLAYYTGKKWVFTKN